MFVAILSNEKAPDKLNDYLLKVGAILGRHCALRTYDIDSLNEQMYLAHTGNRILYGYDLGEDGRPVNLNPITGNIRHLAMKKVVGFRAMPPDDKKLVYATLACLYGMEATLTPFHTAKFVVTYISGDISLYKPLKIAVDNGFKVINIATKVGLHSLQRILLLLSKRTSEKSPK